MASALARRTEQQTYVSLYRVHALNLDNRIDDNPLLSIPGVVFPETSSTEAKQTEDRARVRSMLR